MFETDGSLATVDPRNSTVTPLGMRGEAPSWSPDGRKIVFMRELGPRFSGDYRLFLLDFGSSQVRRLTTSRTAEFQPAWSPTGEHIAYTDRNDVLLVRADGTGARRLTRGPARDGLPVWSPDGKRIAYSGRRHCSIRFLADCPTEVFVMNADGSAKRRVTRNRVDDAVFSWSPDGSTLAVARFQTTAAADPAPRAIALVRPDGTGDRRITPFSDAYAPAWAPAGTRLVFDDEGDLWTIAADGSDRRRLTSSEADDQAADWAVSSSAAGGQP